MLYPFLNEDPDELPASAWSQMIESHDINQVVDQSSFNIDEAIARHSRPRTPIRNPYSPALGILRAINLTPSRSTRVTPQHLIAILAIQPPRFQIEALTPIPETPSNPTIVSSPLYSSSTQQVQRALIATPTQPKQSALMPMSADRQQIPPATPTRLTQGTNVHQTPTGPTRLTQRAITRMSANIQRTPITSPAQLTQRALAPMSANSQRALMATPALSPHLHESPHAVDLSIQTPLRRSGRTPKRKASYDDFIAAQRRGKRTQRTW